MTRFLLLALLFLAGPAFALPRQAEVEQLLAADRAFSAAAAGAPSAADGLAPMFDAEAVMPVPGAGPGFATGRDAVIAAFRDSPAFREGRLSWAPIRGGISADGLHGFTYGYLTLTGGDPARRNRKYLAYWIRRPAGWRVVAYRQLPRAPGEVPTAMLPPSLPAFAARRRRRPARDRSAPRQPPRRRAGLLRPRPAHRPARRLPRIWPRRRDEHGRPRPDPDRPRRGHRRLPRGRDGQPRPLEHGAQLRRLVGRSRSLDRHHPRATAPPPTASPPASPSSPSGAATAPARPGATSRSESRHGERATTPPRSKRRIPHGPAALALPSPRRPAPPLPPCPRPRPPARSAPPGPRTAPPPHVRTPRAGDAMDSGVEHECQL